MTILPKPRLIKLKDKKVKYNGITLSEYPIELSEVINYLTKNISLVKQGTLLEFKKDKNLNNQEYNLTFNDKIIFAYGNLEAAYYGVLTLIQILKQNPNELPLFEIKDNPAFECRGLMLDISRNRVYKLETFYKIIDFISELKMNELQFNVEGNSYYYPSKSKYYKHENQMLTKEDVSKIDAYAKKRFVKLIPNQNSFGHMSFWLNQKEFNHLAECPKGYTWKWMVNAPSSTLNPLLTDSIKFVESLFDEYLAGFSSDIVNIGADEPFELGFEKSKEAVEKYGKAKIYLDYISRLHNYFKSQDKKIMMWADVIKNHPETLRMFNKNITVLEWGYDASDFHDEILKIYHDNDIKFYVCPGTSMWNSISGIHQNMIPNTKRASFMGSKYNAKGYLLTDWGDGGSWQTLISSYIPYSYGASYAWNSNTEDDLILDYMNKFFNVEGLASFLMKLGKYSLIEKRKTDNATKLFKLLYIQQTDHINLGVNYSDPTFILKDKEYLPLEIYQEYVTFFENLFLEYNKFDHNNILVVVDKEIKYMLEVFLGASKLGVLLTDLHNHSKEKFLEVLNHLLNARILFEEVWFIRNKESDFELSIQRLDDLIRKIKAIVKG